MLLIYCIWRFNIKMSHIDDNTVYYRLSRTEDKHMLDGRTISILMISVGVCCLVVVGLRFITSTVISQKWLNFVVPPYYSSRL